MIFSQSLPKGLCFYKPSISTKVPKGVHTLKRDGMMHVICSGDKLRMYSRTMIETTSFPHILKKLYLPYGTILLGELVFIRQDGQDDFSHVSTVCRSSSKNAQVEQALFGKLSYYIFDIAFFASKYVLDIPFIDRRELYLPYLSEHVLSSELIGGSADEALKFTTNRGMEGIVTYSDVIPESHGYTITGNARRPKGVVKTKPIYENDFTVYFNPENNQGEWGAGKHLGLVGSVALYKDGKFVCLCGGGLTDAQRKFYIDATYPRIWTIKYDSITHAGALRFPSMLRDRTLSGDLL